MWRENKCVHVHVKYVEHVDFLLDKGLHERQSDSDEICGMKNVKFFDIFLIPVWIEVYVHVDV